MAAASPIVALTNSTSARLTDSHGRVIHDLRVSITDSCNYKCVYCRTGEVGAQYSDLPIEDYLRIIRLAVHPTGYASRANEIGVTVSMDAVDAPTFERITRVPGSFDKVLAGIRAARDAGLAPVKLNCVLLRGFNDDQVEGFARFAREEEVVVRFIEFMPLEEGRLWTPEIVVPLKEIVARIGAILPLVELDPREASETARRYGFSDGKGEIGIIAPVTQAFCGACSRVRLTSDGKIRTCLFSQQEHDLYGRMSAGASDDQLRDYIHRTIQGKEARHHIGEPGFLKPSRSMVHIGG